MIRFRYVRWCLFNKNEKRIAEAQRPHLLSFLHDIDKWNAEGDGRWLFYSYNGQKEAGEIAE